MRILVTGGVRSGKSRHAEGLLADAALVRYVAPGPTHDDADWAARVRAHQERRPASWETVETRDLAAALGTARPVLVDCLGTWLTGLIDAAGAWDHPVEDLTSLVVAEVDAAIAALGERVVLVTNEVGLGVVPEHRSGRLFRDLLGLVNQRFAQACDEVHLVIAGRVLKLLKSAESARRCADSTPGVSSRRKFAPTRQKIGGQGSHARLSRRVARASSTAAPITSPVTPPKRRVQRRTRVTTTSPGTTPRSRTPTAATGVGTVRV